MSLILFRKPEEELLLTFDLHTHILGPAFQGFTNIAPGLHCLTAAPSPNSPHRSCLFFFLDPGAFLVFRWELEDESLEAVSGEVVDPYQMALTPYPSEDTEAWRELTCQIDLSTLKSILPFDQHRVAFSFNQDSPSYDTESTHLPVIGKKWDLGIRSGLDRSSQLIGLIPKLISLFQLSYLMLTHGLNYAGLQLWRDLLLLACSSSSAWKAHEELLGFFLRVLRHQLGATHHGADLLDELFASGNDVLLLIGHLHGLYVSGEDSSVLGTKVEAEALRRIVKAKHGWDLAEEPIEPDEDQPQIVQL